MEIRWERSPQTAGHVLVHEPEWGGRLLRWSYGLMEMRSEAGG